MAIDDATCWTLIRGAAERRNQDREDFARCYAPVIRAYLGARWRGSTLTRELEDAMQEVFLDCFRDGGALNGNSAATAQDHVSPRLDRTGRSVAEGRRHRSGRVTV